MATAKVASSTTPAFRHTEPGSTNLTLATFPSATKDEPKDVDSIAQTLIDKFNSALSSGDTTAIIDLFLDDCYWRDHLALSWEYHTLKGTQKIKDFLGAETKGLKKLTINRDSAFRAPHYGALDGAGDTKGIEFFVEVESKHGTGMGIARILEESGSGKWKIFSLFTTLTELKGHESATLHRRPRGVEHGEEKARANWQDKRDEQLNFENGKEPAVLIVGECPARLWVIFGAPSTTFQKSWITLRSHAFDVVFYHVCMLTKSLRRSWPIWIDSSCTPEGHWC